MLLAALLLTSVSVADDADALRDRDTVRVGVVAFDDFPDGRDRISRLLADLSKSSTRPLRFRLAVGTYGDVEHWMAHGMIDVAFVTPGLFTDHATDSAVSRSPRPSGRDGDKDPIPSELLSGDALGAHARYLATFGLPPSVTPWASDARRKEGFHDRFRSSLVVRRDSTLQTIDDVASAASDERLRFIMVHPLSVSGAIAPRYALAQRGIYVRSENIDYTHSHSGSVRALLADTIDDERERVAFLWDDALRAQLDVAEDLRIVRFPELEALVIPQEMAVARRDFDRADEIRQLLRDHKDADGRQDFLVPDDWPALRAEVVRWRAAVARSDRDGQSMSVDEIGRVLLHYARTQPRRPRLALVLSGGGAKCSYQVGAVAAIEEKLALLRAANPQFNPDIDLVVGTSGGAINALPVALGITKSEAGRQQFRDVWISLDQRDIVRPARLIRGNIGLWFALLQAGLVLAIVRWFVPDPAQRAWWFGGLFALLGAVQMAIAYFEPRPWRLLGTSHWAHHTWLWLVFGARASAWSLLLLGAWILVAQAVQRRKGKFLAAPPRLTSVVLTVGLIGLPLLQVVMVLFLHDTLSGGEGMERALATHYPALIDGQLDRRGLPALDLPADQSDADRLRSASRQVFSRGLVERDLVITGSRLESKREETNSLPTDLYFHARGSSVDRALRQPPFGRRGIAMEERPELALDVVLGSGSIFPVFPSRRLNDFPTEGEDLELVDGGFAHNSPIEAAVLWGATHIILIEASPEVRLERTNFVTNAAASFEHLYEQSQLLDARSRGKVAIFTLAPEPPHLCVLDFADNLIEESIDRGYRDAFGRGAISSDNDSAKRRISGTSRFRKELGEPLFVEIEPMAN
jgi:predicted acylesterase/phospholipase RssA/ABC-type phosphate/phosphonate transport system substrate-binding protein